MENLAMQEIATTLAHEIKNPLALISANIELLELDTKNSKYEIIKREVAKINSIMLDFLNLNAPNALESDISTIYMYEALEDVLAVFKESYKDIKFSLFAENMDISLMSNYKEVQMVFNNLIKNAVEAQSTKIDVHLSTENSKIVVKIVDNGIGIKDTSEVFVDFYTTKKSGSGLGLSICKKIVDSMNGNIELTSGQLGTTALVRL